MYHPVGQPPVEGALLPQGQRETHNLLIWKNKRKAAKKPLLSLENSGFYGKALQSRYFKFSICHLDILLNGLLGRAAFAAFERFATGKTSADCARRRVSERNRREIEGCSRLWAAEPKTKGHPFGCPFVLVDDTGLEPVTSRTSTKNKAFF